MSHLRKLSWLEIEVNKILKSNHVFRWNQYGNVQYCQTFCPQGSAYSKLEIMCTKDSTLFGSIVPDEKQRKSTFWCRSEAKHCDQLPFQPICWQLKILTSKPLCFTMRSVTGKFQRIFFIFRWNVTSGYNSASKWYKSICGNPCIRIAERFSFLINFGLPTLVLVLCFYLYWSWCGWKRYVFTLVQALEVSWKVLFAPLQPYCTSNLLHSRMSRKSCSKTCKSLFIGQSIHNFTFWTSVALSCKQPLRTLSLQCQDKYAVLFFQSCCPTKPTAYLHSFEIW